MNIRSFNSKSEISNISNHYTYFLALLHHENPLHATLSCSAVEALRVIELPRHEYLLVFNTLAAYVDRHGRRSREREIMYPALPTAISMLDLIVKSFFLLFLCF